MNMFFYAKSDAIHTMFVDILFHTMIYENKDNARITFCFYTERNIFFHIYTPRREVRYFLLFSFLSAEKLKLGSLITPSTSHRTTEYYRINSLMQFCLFLLLDKCMCQSTLMQSVFFYFSVLSR